MRVMFICEQGVVGEFAYQDLPAIGWAMPGDHVSLDHIEYVVAARHYKIATTDDVIGSASLEIDLVRA